MRIYPDARVIAEENKVLLPGLINTHLNVGSDGIFQEAWLNDLPLREWSKSISGLLSPSGLYEFVNDANRACMFEMA